MQIKVYNTRMQEVTVKMTDSPYPNSTQIKTVLVTEAKLVTVPAKKQTPLWKLDKGKHFGRYVDPVLISETEKIQEGNLFVDMRESYKGIYIAESLSNNFVYDGDINRPLNWCFKVVAMPSQFSHKHLQAIVEDKLKVSSKVLVECEYIHFDEVRTIYRIKLSARDHVTIFRNGDPTYSEEEVLAILDKYDEAKWGQSRRISKEEQLKWFNTAIKLQQKI